MVRLGLNRFADLNGRTINYVPWAKINESGKQAVDGTTTQRLIIIENLYHQRKKLHDAITVHPWPHESALTLANASGSLSDRRPKTECIPDAIANDLANVAIDYVRNRSFRILEAIKAIEVAKDEVRAAGCRSRAVSAAGNFAAKTVVIDDPVSSLDEHRSLTTVQEIRRLSTRVSQVVILSHSKPFLCRIWEGADQASRVALHVVREGNGSTITAWNVDNDSVTEHDRRNTALRNYLTNGAGNDREIARSIRPHTEAFFRVAYPEHFPPGTLLGPFRGLCEQKVNTTQQILNAADIQELRSIVEYANRFHHDSNPAWESEVVNTGELTGFVTRVLTFVKRT